MSALLKAAVSRRAPPSSGVHLFGLQRSGTNAVEDFLEVNYDVKVQPDITLDRASPHHKHFRLYDDRSQLPEPKYNNDAPVLKTLRDLDDLLGVPHTHKYIVVVKNARAWLVSIRKWAKSNKWALQDDLSLMTDYARYVQKWAALRKTDPSRVFVVDYIEFVRDAGIPKSNINKRLAAFLETEELPEEMVMPDRVPQSKAFTKERKDYYLKDRYMEELTRTDVELISRVMSSHRLA